MAELLSSASAWMNGGRAVTMGMPTSSPSFPARGSCAAAPLEVALPFGPSLRLGGGVAPVHHMGGGPRTFPGGVTKWQWKRMQLKKSRQIEKARLMREKHIYEARRRSELLAASPVLEMPWQKMSRVRPPNYITADEQITKLAARFQRGGSEDLWTEKDGPESFEVLDDKSSPHFSPTKAHSQDTSHWGSQNAGHSDEQWNTPHDVEPPSRYAQSFGNFPRIRPASTPYSEPFYKGRSREEQWNTPQDVEPPSQYAQSFQQFPRIRPASTPHSEPYYKGRSREEQWNTPQDMEPPSRRYCQSFGLFPQRRPATPHSEPYYKGRSRDDEQLNRPQDVEAPSRYSQSFGNFPQRRPASTPHSEPYYKGRSREGQWNRPQDVEPPSRYAQSFGHFPQIRPASTPHSEPYYRGRSRDSYR